MRVFVIGGGGREHALVWKLRQSPGVSEIFCAPGNAGIDELATAVDIDPSDIAALVAFARQECIDLTVPGPELPLTLGVVDALEEHGLRAFGPSRRAAQLEGSKVFTKHLLRECGVPSGFFSSFSDEEEARRYVREVGAPIVVKADGLAAGKGVILCDTVAEAEEAIGEILGGRIFGEAGATIVVEEFLCGEEASFMAVTDGVTVLPLASSQDHKRAHDGDRGPNTGGMGAYSPAPVVTEEMHRRVMEEVLRPVVRGLAARGIVYKGVLYAGLMIGDDGPKVLEFNVRFGDPECQAILARFQGDLLVLMNAAVDGRLGDVALRWDHRAAACVVLAAEGYPGSYEKGRVIQGLETLQDWSAGMVFHAGTARRGDQVVTNGGRVLGVTGLGNDIAAAVAEAYRGVAKISWDGMQYRSDIGHRALRRGDDGKD
jgi:phosphoribosylamine--glycine ligase